MNIRLSAIEARIIGSLIEKQITTPDQYPLSLNALVNACNQKSNREPLMQLDEPTVKFVVDGLATPPHGRGEIRIRQPRAEVSADLLQHRVRQPQVHAAGNRDHLRAAVARTADAGRAARSRAAHGGAARSRRHRDRCWRGSRTVPTARIVAQLPRESGRRDSRWAQLFEELPESAAGHRRRSRGDQASEPPRRARRAMPSWPRASRRSKARSPRCAPSSPRSDRIASHEPARLGAKRRVCWSSRTSS